MDLTSSPSVVGFCRARFLWQKYVRATQEIRGYAAESDECSNCRLSCVANRQSPMNDLVGEKNQGQTETQRAN